MECRVCIQRGDCGRNYDSRNCGCHNAGGVPPVCTLGAGEILVISNLSQFLIYFLVLAVCIKPLGLYMAKVYRDEPRFKVKLLDDFESWLYRICGVEARVEMNWGQYATALLSFSLVSFLGVYAVQRLQGWLPLNPEALPGVSPDSSFNTAVSFLTNTNWQGYGGETTMSYCTQMLALTVQNFVSAAVGMAVLVALARGFQRKDSTTIGNFWIDLTRGTLYILLPLAMLLSIALVSQGVVQSLSAYQDVKLLEPTIDGEKHAVEIQRIAVGPAASQVAIKQLGTNGGGFFNVNSAHPLENPTPLSNLLQMVSILLIPAALCYTFGELVGDRRQGWTILAAMTVILVPLVLVVHFAEQTGNPLLSALQTDAMQSATQAGGNMEGKETRFGIINSAIWAVATTAASNGSVNSMHDSFTPIGGLIPLLLMQLGEVVFGGVGSGLYGMLVFVLVAVFIAGLMVGRTPEYLGKKIGAFEIKMAALAILLPCSGVLLGTACAVLSEQGRATVFNPGPHGFSEVLYAFSSASNNNGSAFAGLGANTPFYNALLAIAMFIGRFGVILPVLGIAGSLAAKRTTPVGPGTLPTHTPLFIVLLVTVVIVVGALSFFPALALGPIVEHLTLHSPR